MKPSSSLNLLKPLSLTIIAFITLVFLSCTGKSKTDNEAQEEYNTDVVEEAESYDYEDYAILEEAETEEEADEEADEEEESDGFNDNVTYEDTSNAVKSYVPNPANYASKDYQTYNLRGKVKSVSSAFILKGNQSPIFSTERVFGKNGKEVFPLEDEGIEVKVKRDKADFLEEIIIYDCLTIVTEPRLFMKRRIIKNGLYNGPLSKKWEPGGVMRSPNVLQLSKN